MRVLQEAIFRSYRHGAILVADSRVMGLAESAAVLAMGPEGGYSRAPLPLAPDQCKSSQVDAVFETRSVAISTQLVYERRAAPHDADC